MPKNLKHIRKCAFLRQDGHCIYCHKLMWLSNPLQFASQQKLTPKQALRFQCTTEHLFARRNGGTNAAGNIAAACLYCNRHRHMRKAELTPAQFEIHVRNRIERGRWHA